MSLSLYDPFVDPFFTLSVPSVTREPTTRDDTSGVMRPRMDLYSTKDNEMIATFELPGLKKEDVQLDVHNNRLVVSGQCLSGEDLDPERIAVRERRYGKFSRNLPLPSGIKPEEIKANMEHGILTVKFPKSKPEKEVKRIPVS